MIYQDIYINQGCDYIDSMTFTAPDGSPVDIENYVFSSQLRTSYYAANATANITVFPSDVMNGIASIFISAANTANIAPGRYVYDIIMYDTANVTTRIVYGIATVQPGATWIGNTVPVLPYQ